MFTQLIASRPARPREAAGLAFSILLHGSMITAAVLATERVRERIDGDREPRIYVLPPLPAPRAPEVRPEPRTPPPATPAPSDPLPPAASVEAPPSLPAPSVIPTGIPAPSDVPWTPPVPGGVLGGAGTGPVVATGAPAPLAGGVFGDDQVDQPAALLPRSPTPRYPEALRTWGVEGVARVRFVVDTLGRVEPEGIEMVESSHPAFAAAVRATLPRMRFRPARVGARPVRQLVEFPIVFRVAP